MINAIRGLSASDAGAAQVGVIETTLEPTAYTHADMQLWDIPGANTVAVPRDNYITKYSVKDMDGVVIVASGRSQEIELELMQWLDAYTTPWIYVRSKVDQDITNNQADKGRTPEETIAEIETDIDGNLATIKTNKPKSFVVSSRARDVGQWQEFVEHLDRLGK